MKQFLRQYESGSPQAAPASALELKLLEVLERSRPSSLRAFDQIPMRGPDLLAQVKRVAPQLAGREVAFVGDHDGTSLLLGLLSSIGLVQAPKRMTLLDFDQRLLLEARHLAKMFGFADRLETHLYNVFDALPDDLLQTHDAFYTNPPYGASNHGASARLFITRGIELVRDGGEGFLILPDDPTRPWTAIAMNNTRMFLERHGWRVTRHQRKLHQYHLDDDPTLASCFTSIKRMPQATSRDTIPWAGRRIPQDLIQHFYGKSVPLPFPKYIASDGQLLFEFDTTSPIGHPHDTSHLDFSGQSEQVQHPEVLTN